MANHDDPAARSSATPTTGFSGVPSKDELSGRYSSPFHFAMPVNRFGDAIPVLNPSLVGSFRMFPPAAANQQQIAATKVLCVTQKISSDQLADDKFYQGFLKLMTEDARRFGKLVKIVIPRPDTGGAPVAGVGKVFLEYEDVDGSTKTKKLMQRGWFGGKEATVEFYPENKFADGDYDG